MKQYRFNQPIPQNDFEPLPRGNYKFYVTECGEPIQNQRGNWVLRLKLNIGGRTVFASPWAGTDKNGDERDDIAEFLICVGRAPEVGELPDWRTVVGSVGICHLKTEVCKFGKLKGQEINTVAWFIRSKAAPEESDQEPDQDESPRDIPF